MVLTLKSYTPLIVENDDQASSIRFNCRVLSRSGQVVIDFDQFQDLLSYSDRLSVESISASWALRMKANRQNTDLLKRIHPGYLIEVYAARNTDPTVGAVRDPSKIKRIDTTPDLSVIASATLTPGILPGTTAPNGTLGSLDAIFVGGTQSFIAKTIGISEGTRTVDGGFTRYFNGHTDPGNGAANAGSFSVQGRGRLTAAQADASQIQELRNQMPRYSEAARAAGLNPNDIRLLTNFTDLHTQSPRAARNFLNRLNTLNGDTSFDALLHLRVGAYDGRSTLGSRLSADQRRRMTALEQGIAQHGGSLATNTAPAAPTTPTVTTGPIETQQTERFASTLPLQQYGASRDGGRRRHAGIDLDAGPNATCITFVGGVVSAVRSNPGGYGNYIDVWNANLNVVERLAEFDTVDVRVGQTIVPGQRVGRGTRDTGVFHLEIHTKGFTESNGRRIGGNGYSVTTDPVAYLRSIGIDVYAAPQNVFRNARIQPPASGYPQGTATSVPIPAEIQEIDVDPVDDYYLDKCPHLLFHGVIRNHGFTDSTNTTLTISGDGYGSIYDRANILLDFNSPSTLGRAVEVRSQALVPYSATLIYYEILKNWVESFWGETTGWEVRTRDIPIPGNYITRISESSAWNALQQLSVDGFFHMFVDHTGAICWEKLPWSGRDQSLIDGRNWEDLKLLQVPSWKIKTWDERLSAEGLANFVRVVPTMAGDNGRQDATGQAGLAYNQSSIEQYGGPIKKEFFVPYGTGGDQWYTSESRKQSAASYQTFACLSVLEAIRWFDRPIQRCSATLRGSAAFKIGTRLEITENWHNPKATPGQYYVATRENRIDVAGGTWETTVALVRDRRSRYLGIGGALDVPLPADQYFWFDPSKPGVVDIGADSIGYAKKTVIPLIEQISTIEIPAPQTATGQTPPNEGNTNNLPATVTSSETSPGTYRATLVRNGQTLTSVPSPINGRVIRSFRSDEYGHLVEIQGSDGRSWVLAHLDGRSVVMGQQVRRGQPIGNQGRSGAADRPHVLIQVRQQNGAQREVIEDSSITAPLVEEYLEVVRGRSGSR